MPLRAIVGFGFWVTGLGCGNWGLGFGIWGFGFGIGVGVRVSVGIRVRVSVSVLLRLGGLGEALGFRVSGFGFRVFRVPVSGFHGFGLGVVDLSRGLRAR